MGGVLSPFDDWWVATFSGGDGFDDVVMWDFPFSVSKFAKMLPMSALPCPFGGVDDAGAGVWWIYGFVVLVCGPLPGGVVLCVSPFPLFSPFL